jgi:hypothetical protein
MNVRFEAFTAVIMKNVVFWDVAPCRSCLNRRLGGTYRLHFLGRKIRERGTSVSRWGSLWFSCLSEQMAGQQTYTKNSHNRLERWPSLIVEVLDGRLDFRWEIMRKYGLPTLTEQERKMRINIHTLRGIRSHGGAHLKRRELLTRYPALHPPVLQFCQWILIQ